MLQRLYQVTCGANDRSTLAVFELVSGGAQ
jgi:hypothetical protein